MAVITSLTLADGASAHVTAQVLDQYGNLMAGLTPTVVDPGPNTSFVPDGGTTGAGTVTGNAPGMDTLTANYLGIAGTLPVTVNPLPSVPTSIQWTSP
jgi:hypothetical protein